MARLKQLVVADGNPQILALIEAQELVRIGAQIHADIQTLQLGFFARLLQNRPEPLSVVFDFRVAAEQVRRQGGHRDDDADDHDDDQQLDQREAAALQNSLRLRSENE